MTSVLRIAAAGVSLVLGLGLAGAAQPPSPAVSPAHANAAARAIGDWLLTCAPAAKGHKACMLSQTLASERLRKPVSVLSVGRDHTGDLTGSLRMPVGVSLAAGVVVKIDNGDAFTVPYAACHRIGCFAPFKLTAPLLGQLEKATTIAVVARSVSEQPLKLNFSARGFASAYAAYLKEIE